MARSQTPPLRSPSTATCIYLSRAVRDFGDGFIALLLPVYLIATGSDAFEVGVVATLALLGSALTTLLVGAITVRWGPRTLLLAASVLMTATGVAFARASDSAFVFVIAFVGTINPTAGNVSIFVPPEHAVLARDVADRERTRTFAHYSLVGALAAALGSLAAGVPEVLTTLGLSRTDGLELMFWFYAALGIVGGAVYSRIPEDSRAASAVPPKPLGPSRAIVIKLAALFAIDAFAGGFAVQSLLALWLFQEHGLSLTTAGTFFFASGLLAAGSFPVAAWLSKRIGLINTMVYTHIPSSVCLIAAAFVPSLGGALGLLLLRAALSQMDVPARASYVMAVVTPEERAAAASLTSVPRSLASATSPALAGALLAAGHAVWPLLICGGLKILYDLVLLWTMRRVKPPEEMAAG